MSTLKANSYQHVDRASPSITINSDGSVSISSTVTYEDVTSVDAVGIVTARSGLRATAGGLTVTAGISTFGDDVVFTGAAANVTWDKSTDDLIFNDNAQAKFGTGGDLSIYHSSSDNNSYIIEGGSGSLMIQGDVVNIGNVGSTKYYIRAYEDGKVELRHAQSTKLQTTTSGISVSDELNVVGLTTIGGDVSIADKIIHTGDTNTAIRFPAADTITAETGGSERLRIESGGNIGIGTDNPNNKLHVYGGILKSQSNPTNTGTDVELIRAQSGSGGGAVFTIRAENAADDNSNWDIKTNANEDLKFTIGSANESLRIASTGKVGIGSDAPSGTLSLLADNPNIRFDDAAGSSSNNGEITLDNTQLRIEVDEDNVVSSSQIKFRVDGSDKMTLDSSGRLMIGNTAAANLFSVANNLVVGSGSGSEGITIYSDGTNDGIIAFADGQSDPAYRMGQIIYNHNGNQMHFRTNGNTDRFVINADGNSRFTGIVTATQFVPTTIQTSHKNIIVNGDMQVRQYGASSTASNSYVCDRWNLAYSGQDEAPTFNRQNVTSGGAYDAGFRECLRVTNGNQTGGAGTSDFIQIKYVPEAQDIAQSGWQYKSPSSYITLSFWIKSSVAQAFTGSLWSRDGTQKNYKFNTPSLSANTWTKVTKTIPGHADLSFDNDNGIGAWLFFYPFLGTGYTTSDSDTETWIAQSGGAYGNDMTSTWWTTNDATWELTGVQLEAGSQATPFEHISYGEQLRRCQRYFWKHSGTHLNLACWSHGVADTGGLRMQSLQWPVPMRATPSLSYDDNDGNATRVGVQHHDKTNNTNVNIGFEATPNGTDGGFKYPYGVSGFSAGDMGLLTAYNFEASAEL